MLGVEDERKAAARREACWRALLKRQAAAHAACQLRVVLLQALPKMRWERMQAVWTQWMRSRQAEAARRGAARCCSASAIPKKTV